MNKSFLLLTCLSLLCISIATASADEDEQFPSLTAVGPYETPSRYACGTVTYNLGPTGARGWMRAYNGGKLFWGENGREFLITHVDPGSPADGKLQVFDVIVGTDGQTFQTDAYSSLGKAIARAQRADGLLSLQRWRNGKTSAVTVELPRLAGDSVAGPIVAEHSQALRTQFLAFIADSMHPDGFHMHPSYACLNALYLLANDQPEHLDLVRRHIRHIIDDMPGPDSEYGPWNWVKGPEVILMSEYFLKTGDRSVLPAIDQNLKWMRASQSYAGGFGHGGPYGGYGHVGLPGMFCAIGATLARECGVKGYDDMIAAAERFYARAAGLGKVGYGGFDADTGLKTLYGDNGKSGTAALLFACLGDERTCLAYADTAGALAAYSESGHTGNFWSFSWGAMGANMASLPYRKHFAEELDWYYAMARTWRGGMTAQPWLASMDSYAPGGEELATGGMALRYCTPLKSLRMLGGEKSVLSQNLVGALADARQLIYDKQYSACMAALDRFNPTNQQHREQAGQLKVIAERQLKTIALTLASIQSNIDKGDLYTAERQLNALKPTLADAGQVERIDRMLKIDKSVAIIAAGKSYYDAMQRRSCKDREFFYRAPGIVFDTKQRQTMQEIAASADSGAYAGMAAEALRQWPADTSGRDFKTLIDEKVTATSKYRMYVSRDADAEQGVGYRYYEFESIPQNPQAIRDMKPVKEGTVRGFDLSARKRDRYFAFVFHTFVEVKNAGEYQFTLSSDDGSALSIDGEQRIDNGGVHGMTSKTGTVQLSPGRHELECLMFQGGNNFGLRLDMIAQNRASLPQASEFPFQVADPAQIKKLKLRVNASGPVLVSLNDQVICQFHKKRKKGMFEDSWKEWEEVTLRPEALRLLKQGKNILSVVAESGELNPDGAAVGVQLQTAAAAQ